MLEIYKELNKINVGNKKLTLGDKYIWRPISHILLSPLIYLGFKNPNSLTIISIISLFLGLLLDKYWLVYFVIWAILDCADGSLARYNIKTKESLLKQIYIINNIHNNPSRCMVSKSERSERMIIILN